MSVYSGFAVRSQESNYNKTLYNMICLLQYRLTKSFNNGIFHLFLEPFDDEKFTDYFKKFYLKLSEYDQSKHLVPKFSYACKDLASHFGILQELPPLDQSMSQTSYKFDFNGSFKKTQRSPIKSIQRLNNTITHITPKDIIRDSGTQYKENFKANLFKSKRSRYRTSSDFQQEPYPSNNTGNVIFQSVIRHANPDKQPNPRKPWKARSKTVVKPRVIPSIDNGAIKLLMSNYGQKLSKRVKKYARIEARSINRENQGYPNANFSSIN